MAMEASMVPAETRKITSRCSPDVDRCSHTFEIHGYSLQDGLGVGIAVRSGTFAVGGHEWRISYYPNRNHPYWSDYSSVFLDFMGSRGSCVIKPITGESMYVAIPRLNIDHTMLNPNVRNAWGCGKFIKRSLLQTCLHGDRLTIECDLSVVVGSQVSGPESETTCENAVIEVPPSNLSENLRKLLETKEGTDVSFMVNGVVFHAHKVVLAARLPVVKAELYGIVGGRKTRHGHITIQDMEPGVFRALLHFIYTDSLPAADDDCDHDDEGVVKHLLVAADRYGVDRMRLMCESMLCRRLVVENVADTLALADRHYCSKLKDACISFISSRKRIKDVMGTQGYEQLKKSCPSIVMNLLEESVKSSVS